MPRPVPLRRRVYDALLEMITSGHLTPGQHLVETELAERLGVSRQPVREALQQLCSEGWVDLRPGFGAFVHTPTVAEAEQLFHVRALLETEASRLAAGGIDAEGTAALRAVVAEGTAAQRRGDTDAAVAANSRLHRIITECSGNAVLAELAGQVARRVRWYYGSVVDQRGSLSWQEHTEIVDAIEAGDGDRAVELMREHIERTRLAYLRQLRRHSGAAASAAEGGPG